MNLPNLISILRILLVPLIVWLISQEIYSIALTVFCVAAISDALDGMLARLLKCQSKLGAYLDPLADKALLVSIYIALNLKNILPTWVVIAVVFRDIMIIFGTYMLFMFEKNVEIKPILISKLNTFLQLLLIIYLLIALSLKLTISYVESALFLAVGITTVLSGTAYLLIWLKQMNTSEMIRNGK